MAWRNETIGGATLMADFLMGHPFPDKLKEIINDVNGCDVATAICREIDWDAVSQKWDGVLLAGGVDPSRLPWRERDA